jgi:hypothetical protein
MVSRAADDTSLSSPFLPYTHSIGIANLFQQRFARIICENDKKAEEEGSGGQS